MRLLDPRFKYTPSTNTNVAATWRRFGYRPTTEAERARQRRAIGQTASAAGVEVTHVRSFPKVTALTSRLKVKK